MLRNIHKILIIEDDRKRIQLFEGWMPEYYRAIFVKTAGAALGLLERDKGRVYAGICLDHDLQQQIAVSSDRDLSGTTVVNAIIRYISSDVPVLVHSRNEKRACYMERKLVEKGFYVTKVPMDQLVKEKFLLWLEEVGQIWSESQED